MSVSAYGRSIAVPRVGSTSRTARERHWFIAGMKPASYPLELAASSSQGLHAKEATSPSLRRLGDANRRQLPSDRKKERPGQPGRSLDKS